MTQTGPFVTVIAVGRGWIISYIKCKGAPTNPPPYHIADFSEGNRRSPKDKTRMDRELSTFQFLIHLDGLDNGEEQRDYYRWAGGSGGTGTPAPAPHISHSRIATAG